MPVVAFSVMNIVLTLASFLWLNRTVACVFILVGASAQYFIMTYGIIIDRSMIANMMDTTPAETFALLTPQMLITLGVSGILAALIACWIRIKPIAPAMRSVLFRGANILISALLIVLVAAFFYKDYASLFRNNKELVKSSAHPTALWRPLHGIHTRGWPTCRWYALVKTPIAIR